MARLVLTADEAAVCEAVGVRSFVQARSLVAGGALVDVSWDRQAGRGRAAVRGEKSGWVTASVMVGVDGAIKSVSGTSTRVVIGSRTVDVTLKPGSTQHIE